MDTKQIQVIRVRPHQAPELITIDNTLKALQHEVDGHIEMVTLSSSAAIVCNEEGKLLGMEPNRRVGADIIVGAFLIAGHKGSETVSLPETDIQIYLELFKETGEDFFV